MSDVSTLVATLESPDGMARQNARIELEKIGAPAVESLITVLQNGRNVAVWEAAKALVAIHDPRAAPALIETLENNDPGIRWVASDALIALGAQCMRPLMDALATGPITAYFRQGAHHVLHTLISKNYMLTKYDEIAAPVLAALDGPDPDVVGQAAANDARQKLDNL